MAVILPYRSAARGAPPLPVTARPPVPPCDHGPSAETSRRAEPVTDPTAVGKAAGPTAVGKAAGPTAVGKAAGPTVVGNSAGPTAVEKSAGPAAVGQRNATPTVGRTDPARIRNF